MNNKWHDTRLETPSCSHYRKYIVVENHNGTASITVCGWEPFSHYTKGRWMDLDFDKNRIRDNMENKDVLYWMDIPKMPMLR